MDDSTAVCPECRQPFPLAPGHRCVFPESRLRASGAVAAPHDSNPMSRQEGVRVERPYPEWIRRIAEVSFDVGDLAGSLLHLLDYVAALEAALAKIREATNLALPSEQTGPEWERCVRVPVARLEAIDAALASVLGEPAVTNEPKPALHGGPEWTGG